MRTNHWAFLILAVTLSLFLCSAGGCGAVIFDDGNRKADIRLEQILNALQSQDRRSLEKMFSPQALNEAVDFDNSLSCLFELFQGNLESWEQDRHCSYGKTRYGKKSVQLCSWYTVTTDQDEYRFYISDYSIDTINPDNAGLYTLHVIRASEADTKSRFIINWDYSELPGIH